jgi:hypothetical protein
VRYLMVWNHKRPWTMEEPVEEWKNAD